MRKFRKCLIRITSLVSCLVILVSCLVFPASAAEEDTTYFNVLGYSYPNDGDTTSLFNSPEYFYFRVPQSGYLYIDMIVRTDSDSFQVFYDGVALSSDVIGSNEYGYVYRIYGDLKGYADGLLYFSCSGAGSFVSFMSVRASTLADFYYPTTGGIRLWPSGSTNAVNPSIIYMTSPGSGVSDIFAKSSGTNEWTNCRAEVVLNNWRDYDFLDVYFVMWSPGIKSVSVDLDGISIPYEMSFLDSSIPDYDGSLGTSYQPSILRQDVMITLDLRNLDRSESYDAYPIITVTSQYPSISDAAYCSFSLFSVVGRLAMDNPTELDGFWYKLKSFLSSIFETDSAADNAQQSQEQMDYEINLQIVDAMDDWNNNIDFAETGFTSGLSLVSPSVAWISSLASRIFTNMGGFSALYILVGFMSVIMLLLSKSGIAAKIGHIGRNKN